MTQWYEIAANRRALAYIAFSAVVLAAIFLLGIFPAKKQIAEHGETASSLETKIEKQKIFQPVYRRLLEKQKGKNGINEASAVGAVEIPEEMAFDVDTAADVLSFMAGSADMENYRFYPAPESLARDSSLLLVEGELQGPYSGFRDFLLGLVTSPAYHSIGMLEIQSTVSDPEYRLEIWIELE